MSFLLNIIMSNMFFFGFYIFYKLHNYIRGNIRTESHNFKKKCHYLILGKKIIPPTIFTIKTIPLSYNYTDTI